jgi:hypothetical protein
VTPASFTTCRGTLAPDSGAKKAGEPNLLDYKFQCDTAITAYSIIVDQERDSGGAIDDFDGSPLVYTGDGVTPAANETVSCEGVLPSDGINCNTGALGAQLGEYNFVAGTIDPIQAYCRHLPLTPAAHTKRPARQGGNAGGCDAARPAHRHRLHRRAGRAVRIARDQGVPDGGQRRCADAEHRQARQLEEVDLQEVDLQEVDLQEVDLQEVDLQEVDSKKSTT